MTPTWLVNILQSMPGSPRLHCYLLILLSAPCDFCVVLNLPLYIDLIALGILCYFFFYLDAKLSRAALVDLRDYIVIRAIMSGVLLGMVATSIYKVVNYLVTGQQPQAGFYGWFTAALMLTVGAYFTYHYFIRVVAAAGSLTSWNQQVRARLADLDGKTA